MRFETAPRRQTQLDWKESMKFTLKSGEIININIFVPILAASRFRVYRLSLIKSPDVLFSFIDDAFAAFGGVAQELLTDNMKTVMDEPRTEYSKGKVNMRLDFETLRFLEAAENIVFLGSSGGGKHIWPLPSA